MPKKFIAKVVKVSEKTIKVNVPGTRIHKDYGKIIRTNKKILAHDEDGLAKLGDMVEITESRPYSKTKSHKLIKVVEKNDSTL